MPVATVPVTTVPVATVPVTTVPAVTVPLATLPQPTLPVTTVPVTTLPAPPNAGGNGVLFSESFDNNAGADRFDFGVYHRNLDDLGWPGGLGRHLDR